MRKKGKLDLRKKLLLPLQDDLRDSYPNGEPSYEEVLLFKQHLLRLPIFEEKGIRITLCVRKHTRAEYRVDGTKLLDDLALELASSFAEKKYDKEKPLLMYQNIMTSVLERLSSCKEQIVSSGVKEKTFLKIWNVINKWAEIVPEKHIGRIAPVKRVELMKNIIPYFKKYTKLSDEKIYYCIAHILKYFGIEKGNIEMIFKRIKRDYLRKGKPAKKKGIRPLPDLPNYYEP